MESTENMENIKDEKKINVVQGNGNIEISPVSTHLEIEKPQPKNNKNIIIPDVKSNTSKEENKN